MAEALVIDRRYLLRPYVGELHGAGIYRGESVLGYHDGGGLYGAAAQSQLRLASDCTFTVGGRGDIAADHLCGDGAAEAVVQPLHVDYLAVAQREAHGLHIAAASVKQLHISFALGEELSRDQLYLTFRRGAAAPQYARDIGLSRRQLHLLLDTHIFLRAEPACGKLHVPPLQLYIHALCVGDHLLLLLTRDAYLY